MSRRRFTLAGGVLALVGGIGHLVTSALMRRDVWSRALDEGIVQSVSLDPTPDQLGVAEAFWFSLGSFGAPLLLLGGLVTWLSRRGQHVPGWLGWGIVVWSGLVGVVSGFDAGTFILLGIGVLLTIGGTASA